MSDMSAVRGRVFARVLALLLVAVAVVAALGLGGLGRARSTQLVEALAETAITDSVSAATALAAELVASTGGGDVASARTTTDQTVAEFVAAATGIEAEHPSDTATTLAQDARAVVSEITAARAQVDSGANALTTSRLYLAAAESAAGWPLAVARTADPGTAVTAALVDHVATARTLVSGVVAGGDPASGGSTESGVAALAALAAQEGVRQVALAAVGLVAVVLAAVAGWFGRRRPTRAQKDGSARTEAGRQHAQPAAAPVAPAAVAAAPVPATPAAAPATPMAPGPDTAAAAHAAARRDLALLNRQLVTLDRLEQSEQDPAVLGDLFELDNLAVRLRRNAESLLVLAGGEHGRRSREVAATTDVLRAATSQIEQYDRVRIALEHDPALHAAHVVAVAHLFAELFENATAFSEPGTVVEVSGACDAEAMTVRVVDRGIGLSDQELAAVGACVQAPQDVVDGRIGLHVVARLADRLGVRVGYERGQDGIGTVVVVRLPRRLFAEQEISVPVLRTARDDSALVLPVPASASTVARLVAAGPSDPAFEPVTAPAAGYAEQVAALPRRVSAEVGTVVPHTAPAASVPPLPDAAPSFESLLAGPVPAPSSAGRRRRARRTTGSVVVPHEVAPVGAEGLTPAWVPVSATAPQPGAAPLPARAAVAPLASTGAFLPAPTPAAAVEPVLPARQPAPASTFLPQPATGGASVPAADGTFPPAAATASTDALGPAAAFLPEPSDPAVARPAVPAVDALAGADPQAAFTPTASTFAPTASTFTPAAPSFAQAGQSFTPADPAATQWSVGTDVEAGIRAAAQKLAMAELSGLTSYRPETASTGAALASRPPVDPVPVAAAPPTVPLADTSPERDAEGLRRRLSAFRTGTSRGRDAAPAHPVGR